MNTERQAAPEQDVEKFLTAYRELAEQMLAAAQTQSDIDEDAFAGLLQKRQALIDSFPEPSGQAWPPEILAQVEQCGRLDQEVRQHLQRLVQQANGNLTAVRAKKSGLDAYNAADYAYGSAFIDRKR